MMNLLKTILFMAVCVGLAGCDEERARATAANGLVQSAKSIATTPEVIGTLQDGRVVKRVTAYAQPYAGAVSLDTHYIYLVDGVVSDNWSTPVYKSRDSRVNVTLPVNPNVEQIMAEADRLRAEQEKVDRAEYERLTEKYSKEKSK